MNYEVMNYANRYIIAAIGVIVVIIIYYVFTQNNPSGTCSLKEPAGGCPSGQTCITGACTPSKNFLYLVEGSDVITGFSAVNPSPIQGIGVYSLAPGEDDQAWTITNNGSSYQLQNNMYGNCLYMNSATDYGVTNCGSPGTSWDITTDYQIINKSTSQCLKAIDSDSAGSGTIIPTVCNDSSQILLMPFT